MSTATYDRAPGRFADAGERLRVEKLNSPKGIGIMTACLLAFVLVIAPITFWMASHIAPEGEHSEGFAHQPLDRPAADIQDPRDIGD